MPEFTAFVTVRAPLTITVEGQAATDIQEAFNDPVRLAEVMATIHPDLTSAVPVTVNALDFDSMDTIKAIMDSVAASMADGSWVRGAHPLGAIDVDLMEFYMTAKDAD